MSTGSISHEQMKEQAQLAGGLFTVFSPQDTNRVHFGGLGPGAPSSSQAGFSVAGSVRAHVGVRLRRDASRIRSYMRVDTADGGQSYGFDSDAFTEHVTGTVSDKPTTLTDLKAALDGNADLTNSNGEFTILASPNESVIEYKLDARPVNNTNWPGVAPPSFTLGGTGAGSPYASGVAEARECLYRVWGQLKGGQGAWALQLVDCFPGGVVHARGAFETIPLPCAHLERLCVEVLWADGACTPAIGIGYTQEQQDVYEEAAELTWSAVYDTELLAFGSTLTGHVALGADVLPLLNVPTLARSINQQRIVAVGTSDAELLARNPFRRGMLVRNLGASEVYLNWITPTTTAATTAGGLKLQAGEIRTLGAADEPPGNALHAIGAAGSNNVYAEDY